MLDAIDRKLLGLLQRNARLSNAELAKEVGLNPSSVFERVRKLERRGVITGYVATVDAEKLGKPLTAFIRQQVQTDAHDELEGGGARLMEACLADPDILECHNVAGEDCYVVKVRAAGPKDLERLIGRLRSLTKSPRSVTNIVLSTYKETAYVEPLEGEEA